MTIQDRLSFDKDKIIKLYNDNYSTRQIGKLYKCNAGTIWVFLKNNNITIKNTRKNYNIKNQYIDTIVQQFNAGISAYQLAKNIGVNTTTIIRWLKSINIDTSKNRTYNPDNLLIDKKDEVVKLFKQGNSCIKIAKILGYSDSNIWKLLIKEGFKPTKIKHTLDESFFEKIDTEEKAYILGFWYADGNVMKSGKCRIALQERDKEILNKIKDILKYTGDLGYKKAKNIKCQPQWELNIDRKKVADDLIKLGCVPAKSMILTFPSEEIVPQNLQRHFIRGYFDGDGSISNGVMIVGTDSFTQKLKEVLPCKITAIYPRYSERERNKTSHQLFIGRHDEIVKFYHFIYDNASIWLSRKKDKFGV